MFVIKCRRYCRGRRSLCSPTKHEIFISRETAYNPKDSENKLDVHCRAQTIVTIAFVFVVFFFNNFSYSGAILWNSLPCDVREAESLRQIKRLLKRDV